MVEAWTKTMTKDVLLQISREKNFPCAPVRNLDEVIHDEHLHARGMLEWTEHPTLGRIALQRSPLRFHESDLTPIEPSEELGASNADVYGGWLGLPADELDRLKQEGVI